MEPLAESARELMEKFSDAVGRDPSGDRLPQSFPRHPLNQRPGFPLEHLSPQNFPFPEVQ
jgi:hypothetical protein